MQKLLERLSQILLCLLAVALLVTSPGWPGPHVAAGLEAQDAPATGLKSLETNPQFAWSAVWIAGFREGVERVQPGKYQKPEVLGTPFPAGDDWLKNLSFVLHNRSTKSIAYLVLDVLFPMDEQNLGGNQVIFPIELGQIPEIDRQCYYRPGQIIPTGTGQPLHFGPRQLLKISLADYSEAIRAKVEERKPFSSVTKCIIALGAAYFEDGMRWNNGGGLWYTVPDPTTSEERKFREVDRAEWPIEAPRMPGSGQTPTVLLPSVR